MTKAPPSKKTVEHPVSEAQLKKAESRLGYEFKNKSLLALALCHASTTNEGLKSNERLEFLGDAVLNLLVSWFLYEGLRDADEGTLSHRRSRMTNGESLAALGKQLKLGELLRIGKGQDLSPTSNMEADLVEACIGAIFLDGGVEAAQVFVLQQIIAAHKTDEPVYNDPKSRLQHVTLARRLGLPEYRLIEATGPSHQQVFLMEVRVAGEPRGRGTGSSKKLAQQQAATSALVELEKEAPPTKDAAPVPPEPPEESAAKPTTAKPATSKPATTKKAATKRSAAKKTVTKVTTKKATTKKAAPKRAATKSRTAAKTDAQSEDE